MLAFTLLPPLFHGLLWYGALFIPRGYLSLPGLPVGDAWRQGILLLDTGPSLICLVCYVATVMRVSPIFSLTVNLREEWFAEL